MQGRLGLLSPPFRVDSGLSECARLVAGQIGWTRGGPNGLDTWWAEWAGSAAEQMGQVRGKPNGPAARQAEWAGHAAGQMGQVCGGPNGPGRHSATALASVPSHVLPIVSQQLASHRITPL